MGLPFPLALDRLARDTPELIPWAWGVNGCASVISAVLATLLAIQFGFHAVILSAIALYAIAALALPRRGAEKFQPTDTLEQTAAARIRLNRGTGPI
jgi:hypothetical protein